MTPLRVLLVGNLDRRRLTRRFYSIDHKLRNGLLRAGHAVIGFEERDTARDLSPIGSSRFGLGRMRRALAETARHFRPDLALFMHTDLLGPEDHAAVRAARPGMRLATVNYDPMFRPATMAAFRDRLADMDAGFVTTGDPAAARACGFTGGRLFFIPNPVDPAVETGRVFDIPREALRWDLAFLGSSVGNRGAQLEALKALLPPSFRMLADLRPRPKNALSSVDFLETLASAAMGPNLPLNDADPGSIHRLYSSDRVAQLLGQGLTVFSPAAAGLEDLYEDGVAPYADRPGLAEAVARHHADDALRRRTGERGWRLARERTDAALVARYIVAVAMGETPPREAVWARAALA